MKPLHPSPAGPAGAHSPPQAALGPPRVGVGAAPAAAGANSPPSPAATLGAHPLGSEAPLAAEPMHGLAEEGSGTALPLRGHLALWLADTAVLMLRVAAILLLLSPLFGAAIMGCD